ncbi:hypothetical protein [Bacillus phage YungSlug]|nr:hypothetical protein [Bacillus phage YungSlug]
MIFVYPELDYSEKVESFEELKAVVYKLHNDFDLRGSNWDWDGAELLEDNCVDVIGRVAYNGRVIKE